MPATGSPVGAHRNGAFCRPEAERSAAEGRCGRGICGDRTAPALFPHLPSAANSTAAARLVTLVELSRLYGFQVAVGVGGAVRRHQEREGLQAELRGDSRAR